MFHEDHRPKELPASLLGDAVLVVPIDVAMELRAHPNLVKAQRNVDQAADEDRDGQVAKAFAFQVNPPDQVRQPPVTTC